MITHELVIKLALAHAHQYGKILIGWGVILIVWDHAIEFIVNFKL